MDNWRVLRGQFQQMFFEAIRVAVKIHCAAIAGAIHTVAIVLQKLPPFEQTDFIPVTVHEEPRPGTGQPVDAQIDQVTVAPIGRHQPAGDFVLLIDARLIAVHLSVDAGAQPSHTCADNQDGFLRHRFLL